MMTIEKINGKLEELDRNWMHQTKRERINGIREAILDLDEAIYNDEINGSAPCDCLGVINNMLLKLSESID